MGNKNTSTETRQYNPVVVGALSEKYGVSKTFVRQSLRGDRTSLTSDTISREYKELCKKVKQVLKS